MRTIGDVHIAGSKTIDDWQAFRATLVVGGDPKQWREAFDSYFHARISLRYLDPIRVLQENGALQGEGFSIVTIQCTLIEFLESTIQGRSYRYLRRGDAPLGPHEYSNSRDLFIEFLSGRKPFANDFSAQLAREFYEDVRCGLLHEARTKRCWTIQASSSAPVLVSMADKILYRDNFHTGLLEFIDWYGEALTSDAPLQEAFIRKLNSLCE